MLQCTRTSLGAATRRGPGSTPHRSYQNLKEWCLSIRFLQFIFLIGLRRGKPSKRGLSHKMPPQDAFLGSLDLWTIMGILSVWWVPHTCQLASSPEHPPFREVLFFRRLRITEIKWHAEWQNQDLSPGLLTPKSVPRCPLLAGVASWGSNGWSAVWWACVSPGNLGFQARWK